MGKWNKLFIIIIMLLLLLLTLGCTTLPVNNASVCKISFDLHDAALLQLNLQNKRAVKSFYEVCNLK